MMMEHDEIAAPPMAAEGMPLSVALGGSAITLAGGGHSVAPLHLVGNNVHHIAGDMGQQVAQQVQPKPVAAQNFMADFKPV